mmetsp:Transcript_12837/g.23118  ORF Transcript_12837/g.23118 Transcript_12837/m.23118 type:complete len:223 (+) Transcript_12837:609-1277(+)
MFPCQWPVVKGKGSEVGEIGTCFSIGARQAHMALVAGVRRATLPLMCRGLVELGGVTTQFIHGAKETRRWFGGYENAQRIGRRGGRRQRAELIGSSLDEVLEDSEILLPLPCHQCDVDAHQVRLVLCHGSTCLDDGLQLAPIVLKEARKFCEAVGPQVAHGPLQGMCRTSNTGIIPFLVGLFDFIVASFILLTYHGMQLLQDFHVTIDLFRGQIFIKGLNRS